MVTVSPRNGAGEERDSSMGTGADIFIQVGRGSTQYGARREAEVDDPAGARIWGQGHGTDTCEFSVESVNQAIVHNVITRN